VFDELQADGSEELVGRRRLNPDQQTARKDARKRFQFEATQSDDELEDELDDNLDEIGDVTKRLKALASAAGEEIDKQNDRLDRLANKTVSLDDKVVRGTDKLRKIK